MLITKRFFLLLLTITVVACESLPTGPSVMTLPGSGKSFDQFRSDDYECKQYAYEQIGGTTPREASQRSGVESAAIGTGLGAATGAAIGAGSGAAIGAGAGLVGGSLIGSGSARSSAYAYQQRYDIGYIQCMYAKGHRVPVSGRITYDQPTTDSGPKISTPPSTFNPPPPPPGNPPLPPPR